MEMSGLIDVDAVFRGRTPAGTFPVPQFEWISLFKPLIMAAVGAETR